MRAAFGNEASIKVIAYDVIPTGATPTHRSHTDTDRVTERERESNQSKCG